VFAVLKKLTGAEHVFLGTPHVSRREGSEDQTSKPLYHLHNDYTGNMKEAYLCALSGEEPDPSWTMEEKLAMHFVNSLDVPAQMKAVGLTAERLAERRMIALNTWRNTSDEPLRSCPLAVADKRTIKSSDGCGGVVGRVGLLQREGQQFYYYPGLTREELLVFIGYDSDAKEHAPCAHSAFDDANTPADAPPRQSIELRCVLVMPAANLIPADSPSDFTSTTEADRSSAAPPADVADPLQTAAEAGAGRAFIDLFAMQTDEAEQRAAIVVEGLSGAGCIAVKCFATSAKASTASPQRQARGEVGRLKQVVDSLRSQLVAKDLQLTQLRRQFNIPQAPATLCPEDCDRISIQSSPSPQRKATRGCATYTVPVESFEPMDTDATPNAPQTLTGAGRPRWRSPALT